MIMVIMATGKLMHRQDFLNSWMMDGNRVERLRKESFQQQCDDIEHHAGQPTSKLTISQVVSWCCSTTILLANTF